MTRASAACLLVALMLGVSCAAGDDDPSLVYQDPAGCVRIFFLAGSGDGRALESNCYALVDTKQAVAAIVDPGVHNGPLMHRFLAAQQVTVQRVLLTHGHGDHTGGLGYLAAQTRAEISLAAVEVQVLPPDLRPVEAGSGEQGIPARRFELLTDRSVLTCGGVRIEVRLTPGHTIGSVCYYLPEQDQVLTGDTLFRGQIGRTDLPLGAGRACLVAYVRVQILSLPDQTCVLPGHGGFTTVGQERAVNPQLEPVRLAAATQAARGGR